MEVSVDVMDDINLNGNTCQRAIHPTALEAITKVQSYLSYVHFSFVNPMLKCCLWPPFHVQTGSNR